MFLGHQPGSVLETHESPRKGLKNRRHSGDTVECFTCTSSVEARGSRSVPEENGAASP